MFSPGTTHIAHLTVKNPTSRTIVYSVNLVIGADQGPGGQPAAQLGWTGISLGAGQSVVLSGPVIMPSVAGAYTVDIDCFSPTAFIKTASLPSIQIG